MICSPIDWIADQIRAYEAAHGCKPGYILITPSQLEMLHSAMASRPQGVRKSLQQWRVLASKGRLKVLSLLVRVVEPCDGR